MSAFLKPEVLYSADGIRIRINRLLYATAAISDTHHSVAAMLDGLQSAPPSLLEPLLTELDRAEADGARAGFDALAPRSVPALQNLSLSVLASYDQSLTENLIHDREGGPRRAWASFFHRNGHGGNTGVNAFTHSLYGAAAGFDYAITDTGRLGLAVGAIEGSATVNAVGDMSAALASLTYVQ